MIQTDDGVNHRFLTSGYKIEEATWGMVLLDADGGQVGEPTQRRDPEARELLRLHADIDRRLGVVHAQQEAAESRIEALEARERAIEKELAGEREQGS